MFKVFSYVYKFEYWFMRVGEIVGFCFVRVNVVFGVRKDIYVVISWV